VEEPAVPVQAAQRGAWEALVREATRTAAAEAAETDEEMDKEAGEEADEEADEEVEEEMDTDNVCQSDASAWPEKLTRLQKACLDFCIALLNYRITRRVYDSPLVCALAVLGVKEEGWKGPEQYPPILSAVIKVARFMVVQQGLELSGADLADPQDSGKETDDSAYQSGPSARRRPKGCLQVIDACRPYSR
jgi:hypothetical protein